METNGMKKKIMVALVIVAGLFVYTATTSVSLKPVDTSCVNVYIDFGNLKSSVSNKCIPISGNVGGSQLLSKAGYSAVGTTKYPTQIVCRVNGLPAPETEPCKTMPPADAYWAILVEHKGKWDWATTGIDGITLRGGEGIGLVYAIKGKVRFPSN